MSHSLFLLVVFFTGEECGYNDLCNDYPSLRCESPQATFCCYGSRGLKLSNNGTVTSCTCTHEFHGTECVHDTQPIPGSVKRKSPTGPVVGKVCAIVCNRPYSIASSVPSDDVLLLRTPSTMLGRYSNTQ